LHSWGGVTDVFSINMKGEKKKENSIPTGAKGKGGGEGRMGKGRSWAKAIRELTEEKDAQTKWEVAPYLQEGRRSVRANRDEEGLIKARRVYEGSAGALSCGRGLAGQEENKNLGKKATSSCSG